MLCIPSRCSPPCGECSGYGISVKGAVSWKVVAEADTVVLDKTGTITYATPRVA
jgi:cation transport ATPase